MEGRGLPDPRFKEFIEQQNSKGQVIGFKLQGNDFLFEFDEQGGWVDQKGKLYDCQGYLIDDHMEEGSQSQDDGSQIDDDEIIDEFEQMLIEEEQGIIRNKNKVEKKQSKPHTSTTDSQFDEQAKTYIQKLKNKEQLRQGLSNMVWIFFKLRSNLYERVQHEVQKKQDTNSKNALIKQIKSKNSTKRQQLLNSNKWLQGQFLLDYSGTSLDDGVYDRYWYGWVKVAPQNYFSILEEIKKSKQFTILKSKTFYALKSKFFLKTKMKDTIKQLKQSLKDVAEDGAVLVKINNLPEEFPLSFILDLIELCGGYLQDIEDIDIVDNFSADMIVKKRTAELFTNIQGYPHDQKQYIWLEIENQKRPIKFNKFFNVQIESEYKPLFRETADVLALQSSPDEVAKFYDLGEKFRLVVNQTVLKKILMFRGESLNVIRVVRFEKKE